MYVPDWCKIIEALEKAGESRRAISDRMQVGLTDRMLRAYKLGAQPAYFRAIGLIELWRVRFGSAELPVAELIRGHRREGRQDHRNELHSGGPQLQYLPQWPVSAKVAVKPVKRGRPRKVT